MSFETTYQQFLDHHTSVQKGESLRRLREKIIFREGLVACIPKFQSSYSRVHDYGYALRLLIFGLCLSSWRTPSTARN